MTVYCSAIEIQTQARVTFHDVTDDVAAALAASGIVRGIAVVSSPHTTCSVLIQEASHDRTFFDVEFLMQDLVDTLEKLAPTCTAEGQYRHPGPAHIAGAVADRGEQPWWSLNVDGHLRSVLLGRSETVQVVDGALNLGEFGRVYFVDFDQVRARPRRVLVTVMGE